MWGLLNNMLIFIFRLAKAAQGNKAREHHKLRQRYLERKKRLYGLDFGTTCYLPRRVTVSVWFRCFGGHWNPVCEYLHWATGAEARLRGHGQAGATGHHSLNTVPSCCLLLCRLLSCMATTVFAHAWIWNSSKYDVMCGTECHLAGVKTHVYFILWSFSNLLFV